MPNASQGKTQLSSWKEVAAYFNATPRTVMRWERERGLPIRRLPGESRSRVYANVAELKAWLDSNDTIVGDKVPGDTVVSDVTSAAPSAAAQSGQSVEHATGEDYSASQTAEDTQRAALRSRRTVFVGATLLGAIVLVALIGLMNRASPRTLPVEAQAIYDTANQNFDRRTPASLAAATDGFQRVTELAPKSAEGFAGLASVYAIMPEYTAMSPAAGLAKAEQNARVALARDPRNARASAVFAFARYYGAQDANEAGLYFGRAVALEPDNVQARHWFATFLLSTGKFDLALKEIDAALALDPASQSIVADRAIILFYAGRTEEAIKILKAMIDTAPDFRSPRYYLAQIAFETGDDETFVRESKIRASLQSDLYGSQLADAAATGLASGGRRGMLMAMLNMRQQQFQSGVGSAIEIARIYLALGDRQEAKRYLGIGISRREPEAAYVAMNAKLAALRDGGAH